MSVQDLNPDNLTALRGVGSLRRLEAEAMRKANNSLYSEATRARFEGISTGIALAISALALEETRP